MHSTLITRIKKGLRIALRPLLPIIRSIRIRPTIVYAKKQADALYSDGGISVCYLTNQFPARPALRTELTHGGAVKLTFLAESFPHSYPRASLLYTVSSIDHVAKAIIINTARNKGIKIVLNQNGVAYPAWKGPGWEEINRNMRTVYEQSDFVIFQSEFCRLGAEKFLGKCNVPSKILYNPIDLDLYRPAKQPISHQAPILLLGGNQFSVYRLEVAAQVLRQLIQYLPASRLIITGRLWGENQALSTREATLILEKLGVMEQVEFTGKYSQQDAAQIFQRADILIHTKYNDPSPTLIGEALACGLPVVYSASGGLPELVGPDAGIGIPVGKSWEKINTPDPIKMAEAIQLVWEKHTKFGEAARQFAEEKFPLKKYVQAHQNIFAQLLEH